MKIAFCIKIAALFTVFTVIACVIGLPAVYLVTAEPDGQIMGVSRYDEQESLTVSEKTHVVVNSKAGKDEYELPFIPTETEHQWDNGTVTTPPTCTMPGVKTYTCKLNSKHTYTEEIPATGHTLGEWLSDETQHWKHCSECEQDFEIGDHIASDWIVDVEATAEAAGSQHKECTVCGKVLETEEIPILATHMPGDINKDGKVNNKDLTRLFQYLSDWEVDVDENALDVNGDGKINNKDLTRLFQYLSDWEVEIF